MLPASECPKKAEYILEPALIRTHRNKTDALGTAPLSNSWIIITIGSFIALHRALHVDCYWVGAVPNLNPKP